MRIHTLEIPQGFIIDHKGLHVDLSESEARAFIRALNYYVDGMEGKNPHQIATQPDMAVHPGIKSFLDEIRKR